MKRLWMIPVLLILTGWIAVGTASYRASSIIAPAIADNLTVDSPREQILSAREADAAAASGGGGWWAFAGLFCVSGGIGIMLAARPFLKELRLGGKLFKRRGGGQRPSPTTITQLPHVPRAPQLTGGEQWQSSSTTSSRCRTPNCCVSAA
jgi:hypothetical protein